MQLIRIDGMLLDVRQSGQLNRQILHTSIIFLKLLEISSLQKKYKFKGH